MSDSAVEMIACKTCGATNRVPTIKLEQGLEPVCGRCKAALPVSTPINVTDHTFSTIVEQAKLPVLVDLWAEWCGPCRMIAPVIEQLAAEMAGRLRVAKLNVDENPATANRFRIMSIPALLIFKDGREVERIVGAQPKSAIAGRLQQWIT